MDLFLSGLAGTAVQQLTTPPTGQRRYRSGTQPVGIHHPNEMPEHPLKTIKVFNLFSLPCREADNCHGMFVLQQEEQV